MSKVTRSILAKGVTGVSKGVTGEPPVIILENHPGAISGEYRREATCKEMNSKGVWMHVRNVQKVSGCTAAVLFAVCIFKSVKVISRFMFPRDDQPGEALLGPRR